MKKKQNKVVQRRSRQDRIRARISGTATRPRLSVFKSNHYLYVQLIDDEAGVTLAAADSRGIKGTMTEAAKTLGSKVAELAKAKKVDTVVFDRGGFKYHGVIAILADAAREGGLVF